ncbi:MAG: class I SAM-dependent methyltransferase [Pseudohongiellaceae bacterium]
MTGFSIDWLELRAAADQRARDGELLSRARRWLDTDKKEAAGITVVDLGAGTGSTLRAFASSCAQVNHPDPISWRLVDRDAALLAEAKRRQSESQRLETFELDLTDIAGLPLNQAQLVTASALFDLVSREFIDALAHALHTRSQQQALGLYAALNYDGATHWTPAHPQDQAVLDAFNRDQRRDKGFGVALGPDASAYMERVFREFGFMVLTASSPWVLDGRDRELVAALIDGIGDAVAADPALNSTALNDWLRFRKANAATGTCTVGHRDLLALPKAI